MATPEKLPEGLKRIFAKKKFDPQNLNVDSWINQLQDVLRKEGTNIQDINRLILQLNRFAEETSSAMKQSVYENYSVFIEAAKDVAVLESDMHQMHHLLNEQKRLLQNLQERSIFGNATHYGDAETVSSPTSTDGGNRDSTIDSGLVDEDDKKNSRKNLASLLESTEGAIFIADVPGRRLEFDSDLIELNPENFSSLHRVHAFLLNDSLVIAKHLPQRRGPLRYRFDQLYELTTLAVVDCKARRHPLPKVHADPQKGGPQLRHPPAPHGPQGAAHGAGGEVGGGNETLRGLAFTLMRFPDTRVLAAETAKLKRRWMDGLDRVKRRRAAEDSKKRESTLLLSPPTPSRAEHKSDSAPTFIIAGAEDAGRVGKDGPSSVEEAPKPSGPNASASMAPWLEERFEDLDVAIAEHNFGQAVDLIDLLRKTVADGSSSSSSSASLHEARPRLDARVSQLTDLLVHQLQPPENAGGVSGPTLRVRASVQSACRHLVRLGRWALACPLLLRYHSAWISAHLDSVRQEGSQLLYAKKLCAVFFHALLNTAKEYENLFENFRETFTAYCRWCQQEVAQFTTSRLRPVLLDNRAVPFHVMCQAMQVARKHAEMYSSAEGTGGVGVDLVFFFEEALLEAWIAAVREQSRVLQEAVEHRHGAGSGERWRSVRLHSEKERQALLAQMSVAGLSARVAARLGPSGRLNLAEHTLQFARSLCQLAGGLGHLDCRELAPVGASALAAVMNAEGRHYRRCLAAEQYFDKPSDVTDAERPFILENLKFLLEDVLPVVEDRTPVGMACLPTYHAAKSDWLKMYEQSQAVSV